MKVVDTTMANSITADEIVTEVMSDVGDDMGVNKERYYRQLFRVWTDLNFDFIRTKREVIVPVAKNTMTIQLPPDFIDLVFFGYIDNCRNLLPISQNRNLAPDLNSIEMLPNRCEKCGQVDLCKMIGQEQTIEQITAAAFIDFKGQPSIVDDKGKTIFPGDIYRKVYSREVWPDGSYIETVDEPVGIFHDDGTFSRVELLTSSNTVCQLAKPCDQCVAACPDNLQMLRDCCCCDAICCSTDQLPYAVLPDVGHYNLFEQDGYIQLSPNSCISKAYIKFVSSGVCKNGVNIFPLVAMNTLVEGTYYLSIAKKKNISISEKERARRSYTAEQKKLLRRMTRLSYQVWREIVDQVPRIPTI